MGKPCYHLRFMGRLLHRKPCRQILAMLLAVRVWMWILWWLWPKKIPLVPLKLLLRTPLNTLKLPPNAFWRNQANFFDQSFTSHWYLLLRADFTHKSRTLEFDFPTRRVNVRLWRWRNLVGWRRTGVNIFWYPSCLVAYDYRLQSLHYKPLNHLRLPMVSMFETGNVPIKSFIIPHVYHMFVVSQEIVSTWVRMLKPFKMVCLKKKQCMLQVPFLLTRRPMVECSISFVLGNFGNLPL